MAGHNFENCGRKVLPNTAEGAVSKPLARFANLATLFLNFSFYFPLLLTPPKRRRQTAKLDCLLSKVSLEPPLPSLEALTPVPAAGEGGLD